MKKLPLPIPECLITQLSTLNEQQLAWLSGYCWGKVGTTEVSLPTVTSDTVPSVTSNPRITIISASQTGNARKVAEQLKAQLYTLSNVHLINAADYKAKHITQEQIILLVVSTQGEGEPPEEAINLYRFLFGKKAPSLTGLSFAVLGLGDSSYPQFCQAAKDIDLQLSTLGATRLLDVGTCDVDYQISAPVWLEAIHHRLTNIISVADAPVIDSQQTISHLSHYDKQHPFNATLSVRQKITGRYSEKDVEHIELDLTGSGLSYQVGDALGVWFVNEEALVDEFLQTVSLSGTEEVNYQQQCLPLRQALLERLELTQNTAKIVQDYANINTDIALQALAADYIRLQQYIQQTPLIELFKQYPYALTAEQVLQLLRPLTPRLYSIASSADEVGEEVHLTVGVVRYVYDGITRTGGASAYLGERLTEEGKVKVFVESNPHFRLPTDLHQDIIMIAAGTGIAPFRAFMQQRAADQATGKNWLFFGNQTFTEDFLYQQEWQDYAKQGLLHRYHFAWSRDQVNKVYVQDKIREQAKVLWEWIQNGAYLYVCGDASRMAKEVEQALLEVICQEGHLSLEEAEEYLADLRQEKRYQRDIY